MKGNFLNMSKTTNKEHTVNINAVLKDRKFFPKLKDKARMPTLTILLHTVLEVLTKTTRQEEEINGIQN
jgi:hypothetical protein